MSIQIRTSSMQQILRRVGLVVIGVVLAMWLTESRTNAALLYNNGTPGTTGSYSDDPYAQWVANSFSLASPSTLDAVRFWGGYISAGTAPASDLFTVRFYTDSAAAPGTLIATRSFDSLTRTLTAGSTYGQPNYVYDATFATVSLAGSTTFWVSIVDNTLLDEDDAWVWSNGPGPVSRYSYGTHTDWTTTPAGANPFGQAFQLFGTIPEPTSLSFLGLGGMALIRRRG